MKPAHGGLTCLSKTGKDFISCNTFVSANPDGGGIHKTNPGTTSQAASLCENNHWSSDCFASTPQNDYKRLHEGILFAGVSVHNGDVEVFETKSAQMKSKIMVITSESEKLILGERLGLLPRRKQEVCS
jgi:hypothetical protein